MSAPKLPYGPATVLGPAIGDSDCAPDLRAARIALLGLQQVKGELKTRTAHVHSSIEAAEYHLAEAREAHVEIYRLTNELDVWVTALGNAMGYQEEDPVEGLGSHSSSNNLFPMAGRREWSVGEMDDELSSTDSVERSTLAEGHRSGAAQTYSKSSATAMDIEQPARVQAQVDGSEPKASSGATSVGPVDAPWNRRLPPTSKAAPSTLVRPSNYQNPALEQLSKPPWSRHGRRD